MFIINYLLMHLIALCDLNIKTVNSIVINTNFIIIWKKKILEISFMNCVSSSLCTHYRTFLLTGPFDLTKAQSVSSRSKIDGNPYILLCLNKSNLKTYQRLPSLIFWLTSIKIEGERKRRNCSTFCYVLSKNISTIQKR